MPSATSTSLSSGRKVALTVLSVSEEMSLGDFVATEHNSHIRRPCRARKLWSNTTNDPGPLERRPMHSPILGFLTAGIRYAAQVSARRLPHKTPLQGELPRAPVSIGRPRRNPVRRLTSSLRPASFRAS